MFIEVNTSHYLTMYTTFIGVNTTVPIYTMFIGINTTQQLIIYTMFIEVNTIQYLCTYVYWSKQYTVHSYVYWNKYDTMHSYVYWSKLNTLPNYVYHVYWYKYTHYLTMHTMFMGAINTVFMYNIFIGINTQSILLCIPCLLESLQCNA